MASTTFDINPVPATSPSANGDVRVPGLKPNANVPSVIAVNNRMGVETLKAGWDDHVPFMRFEPNMPEGSKIKGLLLTLTSNGTVQGAPTLPNVSGGWLAPQALGSGFNWERDIGVSAWPRNDSAPLAQWWNGTGFSNDLTVWHGGAAGFTGKSLTTNGTDGTDWSIGDGITGFNNVTGLVAQLQAYFDAQEPLRGTGDTVDGIPCLFMMHRFHTVNPTVSQNQGFIASDGSVASRRPTLEIEWDPPPAAEFVSATIVDSRGTLEGLLQSELVAATVLDADGILTLIPGATELVAATALDANLINPFLGITPINLTRPPALVNITRPSATATITRVSASAELTRPSSAANLTRPSATATITRPNASATLQRQPDV